VTTTEKKPADVLKHTPGPWREGKNYGAVVSDSPIEGGPLGADDVEHYGGYLICESVAKCNNPIIAAAPDMLAALKWITSMVRHKSFCPAIDKKGECDCGLVCIEAAIAKAERGQ
jgi:hypothetical protein